MNYNNHNPREISNILHYIIVRLTEYKKLISLVS